MACQALHSYLFDENNTEQTFPPTFDMSSKPHDVINTKFDISVGRV